MSRFSPALLVVPLVFALACQTGNRSPEPDDFGAPSSGVRYDPADPGTLVYGRSKDGLTLDPAVASDRESSKVIDCIFETLFDFEDDPDNVSGLIPNLVTDWEHSADRMTWNFTLRDDVRFHDGTPVDAESVKFSLERLINPDHPFAPSSVAFAGTYRRIREIQVLEPTKFVIQLYEPSAVLLNNLAMFAASIVSPTAMRAKGPERFSRDPIGSGPFRFESWTPGKVLTLTANKSWWVDEPSIDRVVFLQIEEWSKRREMLKSGKLDLADNIDANDLSWLDATPNVKVLRAQGMNVCYLAINNEKAPLTDASLRKAIAMAIDRVRVLQVGYAGAGVVATDLLPSNIAGSDKAIVPAQDTSASREIISALELRPAVPLRLAFMKNQRPYLMNPERVALIIRDCLTEAGLAVELESYEWSDYLAFIKRGDHQLALIGWNGDNGDADNFYTPLLSEASIGSTNYTRLHNARFETLLAASREEDDPSTRLALFRRMQDILSRECPCVPLVHTNVAVAARESVNGFAPHPIKLRLYGVTKAGQ